MQRLFCRCHFPTFFPLNHPRASVARPGNLLDVRVKPDNDSFLFAISQLPLSFVILGHIFSSVIPVLPASCHSRALFFSLSFPGLTGEAMDVRVKPEHDRKKSKPGNDIKKNKPEHDTKKSKPKHDTKKNNPIMTERNNPEHDGEAGEHDGGMKRQSMTKKER